MMWFLSLPAVCLILLSASDAVRLPLPRKELEDGQARGPFPKIVIAHRGAPGYLPEHCVASKVLACAMKTDFVEQDLVMTKDKRLIVLHDTFLQGTTNVDLVFKDRARPDGTYHPIDFTLKEVLSLQVSERFEIGENGTRSQKYPERFPMETSKFHLHTFGQEIELVAGLNKVLKYGVGIYPEIKAPAYYIHNGKDITRATLETLKRYGYVDKSSNCYLQCFDPHEVRRVKEELMPEMGMDLKLIQLIAYTEEEEVPVYHKNGTKTNYSFDWMFESGGMKKVAEYADGIGPWYPMVIDEKKSKLGSVVPTIMMKEAHENGLEVHVYTLRSDDPIPSYAASFEDMLDILYNKIGVDGTFTDFPDKAVKFLNSRVSVVVK